jgi:hypothetical protein
MLCGVLWCGVVRCRALVQKRWSDHLLSQDAGALQVRPPVSRSSSNSHVHSHTCTERVLCGDCIDDRGQHPCFSFAYFAFGSVLAVLIAQLEWTSTLIHVSLLLYLFLRFNRFPFPFFHQRIFCARCFLGHRSFFVKRRPFYWHTGVSFTPFPNDKRIVTQTHTHTHTSACLIF